VDVEALDGSVDPPVLVASPELGIASSSPVDVVLRIPVASPSDVEDGCVPPIDVASLDPGTVGGSPKHAVIDANTRAHGQTIERVRRRRDIPAHDLTTSGGGSAFGGARS
jgi:hypothetical protein